MTRAGRHLAGGVNSNIRLDERPAPFVAVRGRGAEVEDLDGRRYVDYVCGMGAVILGHADPGVTEAVVATMREGVAFAGQHPLEAEVAERISAAVPSAEVVRCTSSGSEAVHAAIRIARAATGRWPVVRFDGHYHGWLDSIHTAARSPEGGLGAAAPARPGSRGQPPAAVHDVLVMPWNDLEAVRSAAGLHRGRIATIILEPILCNTGVIPPAPGFLEAIRDWCSRDGTVLIFDEVITGFRVALGGAQSLLGMTPDLTVFGKAVANGFPMSAVAGRRDLMGTLVSGGVLHGGTYNGNPPVMAAARATLDALAADGGAAYAALTAAGRSLMQGLAGAGAERGVPVLTQGPGPVFQMWITGRPSVSDAATARATGVAAGALFADAMRRRGVRSLPSGRWLLSVAHSADHIARTVEAARGAFDEVREAGLGER
ncbi:MAG TPA: aminotransferase class III-fold pyridoxal phosphate-dependent enzyme [bacterium]|nr:aminotransferase class III-fold pyridoxal phosphate-dependent enzyme [bacterium]